MDIEDIIAYKEREIDTYEETLARVQSECSEFVASIEREKSRSELQLIQLKRMR